ncbi:uncharacterized protein LOC116211817 [Punica granatum]|uniref:Uncharacterized protein n=2 Tax=Punica granatum TaxID=22663 RepID=A0A218W8T2_PUNGR|nr:uncharacterized protein LOC116211817 [Punica granatum]OWM69056.1 hypothetical protein CDL15_Pgr025243 [Punica granatum]PKI73340.1 hypothetical protein CRG98_006278 [Punica granatum]
MRRQDTYLNSGSDAYAAAQMQQAQQLERQHASTQFQGQLEAFTPERDDPYVTSKGDGQQGWDRDGPAPSNSMASHVFYEGQGGDVSRSYYHGLRSDPRVTLEKQADSNIRSQSSHDKEMNAGYEKMPLSETFEGLEQKFLDDIMKLSKDLHDAEDAENARHREKLNAIDALYQKQLEALRSRHASRRDEFLRRESNARQHQYQQNLMDHHYQNRGIGPRDPQAYGNMAGSASVGEAHRPYNNVDRYDSYRDRARFPGGGGRDQFEPRGPFPGGRTYDPSSRFY